MAQGDAANTKSASRANASHNLYDRITPGCQSIAVALCGALCTSRPLSALDSLRAYMAAEGDLA